MIRILFVCTGNSARSQMAAAFATALGGGHVHAESAGTSPAPAVHPLAARVMAEAGVGLAGARPQHLNSFVGQPWDYVVTVCDTARDACPVFPGGGLRLHWGLPDPARAEGTEEERVAIFRRVRDDIEQRVRALLAQAAGAGELP